MKPICLEMNAFGPYAGRQIIDFRLLRDRKLFLIYGPTGAGKTTVLDAICYALYGDTSGNTRTGANMRSEYASPEQTTYVTFTFAIGLKTYRIERQPEQEIAKKRGTGLKIESASAVLYELCDDGTDKAVLASKMVTPAVEQLLGFKSEQFRQVVLLPQGDFRKLLLANSNDRQQIMQVLFHTERYSRFQELVKQRHDEVKEKYTAIQYKIDQYLQTNDVAQEDSLEWLRQDLLAQQKKIEAEKKTALASRDAYQQVVQHAQVLADHWRVLKHNRKEREGLQQQQEMMEKRRSLIEQLKKAQLLAEPCRTLEEIQRQGIAAGKALEEAAAKSKQAAAALRDIAAYQHALEAQQEDMRKERERIVQLHGYVEKAHECTELGKQYDMLQKKSQEAALRLQHILSQKEDCKKAIEAAAPIVEKQQQLFVALEKNKGEEKNLRDRLQQEQHIDQLMTTISRTQKQMTEAVQAYTKQQQQAQQDAVDYESVQTLFLQGQAALLAQGLKEGSPCPVCGSREHPQPAAAAAHLPQKEDVERRKHIAATSEKGRQQAAGAVQKLEAVLAEQQRQYKLLRSAYAEEGSVAEWAQRLADKKAAGAVLESAAAQTKQMQKQLQERQSELKQWEEQETAARSSAEEARLHFARTAEAKQRAENELPEIYRIEQTLRQDIQRLEMKVTDYEKKTATARENLTAAQKADAGYQEQVRLLTQQVETLRNQYSESMEGLKKRVVQAGFATVQECRMLQNDIPRLPEEEKQLARYEQLLQQTAGRISQEEAAIGQEPEPDVERYAKELQAKNQIWQQLSDQEAAVRSRYDTLKKGLGQLQSWHAEQAALTEQYKTVGSLYDLVSGKVTGINFERYILGALLDEVLRAANLRLGDMSRRRYQLQRSHTWEDKRIKQIGLDIEVFDNYTGYARPANTLSGGETFLASLALALGLADVVQAYSGGIHLDTIFIDEGFGTLDAETLDFALKALLDLRQDGRLVGIISHVPELRERIDTRLAVQKTDRGSTAAFELL